MTLNACTTVPGQFDFSRHASTTSSAVYIYRPNALANVMVTPGVIIDGNKIFSLNNNYYHIIQLPEGKHQISLDLDERYQGVSEVILDTRPGQNYFLRISTSVKFQMNKPYDRWFDLEQVSVQEAQDEIVHCKAYVSEKKEIVSETIEQQVEDAEYSSQKFRNPFSK